MPSIERLFLLLCLKTKNNHREIYDKVLGPLEENAALRWGTGGGPGLPECRLPPPAPMQVLLARIRPRQVRARPGGGRRRSAARRQRAPLGRKRRGPKEPLGSGAPPPAGWAGLPQRAPGEDPGPPPSPRVGNRWLRFRQIKP